MEPWAKRLKAKMVINDISSSELATKLGVTKSYVSMVFHGKEKPKDAKAKFSSAVEEIITGRKSI